eukprot:Skav212352  [mRNA]  locus=scaffold3038:25852:31372:+ [translate_table: standard]
MTTDGIHAAMRAPGLGGSPAELRPFRSRAQRSFARPKPRWVTGFKAQLVWLVGWLVGRLQTLGLDPTDSPAAAAVKKAFRFDLRRSTKGKTEAEREAEFQRSLFFALNSEQLLPEEERLRRLEELEERERVRAQQLEERIALEILWRERVQRLQREEDLSALGPIDELAMLVLFRRDFRGLAAWHVDPTRAARQGR